MKAVDIAGRRFGLLVAVRKTADRGDFASRPWECVCDCGAGRLILARDLLRAEREAVAMSCGCRRLVEPKPDGDVGQRRRAGFIAAGLCSRCGKTASADGRRLCSACLVRAPANAKRHRYMTPTERLWAEVERGAVDACWEWRGKRTSFGYGRIVVDGAATTTHRLSYRLHVGPIAEGLFVCHRCDNPPCCNPAHLFLGTVQDNTADMDRKGRRRTGCPSDLTTDQVIAIWNSQGTASAVGAKFGISASAVKSIWQGRSWAKVTGGAAAHHARAKSSQPNSVSAERVAMIRDLASLGLSMSEVSRRTGVSIPTATKYARRLDGHIAATRAAITPALCADHRRA